MDEVNDIVLPEIHASLQEASLREVGDENMRDGFAFEKKMKKLLREVYGGKENMERAPQNFIGSWPAKYCLVWGEKEKKGSMFFYEDGKVVGEVDTLVHYHSGDYVVPIAFDFKLSERDWGFGLKVPEITRFLSNFYDAPVCVCRVEPTTDSRRTGVFRDPSNPAYNTMVIPVKAQRPSYIR